MNRSTSSAAARTFLTSWCVKQGVFFDFESAEITSASSSNSNSPGTISGLSIFAKRDLEPGEMFSIIPNFATLQTSQLSLFSVDGNPEQDSSILPQAVRSIVRGSDVEHPWWELAVLVCLHKCVPHDLLEECCLIRNERIVDTNNINTNKSSSVSQQQQRKEQKESEKKTENKILKTDFQPYLDFLPNESPQELLTKDENLMNNKMPGAIKKDFEFNRSQNMVRSARLTRDIPLIRKINNADEDEKFRVFSEKFKQRGVVITPQMMLWSYEMVTSRANNFSFVKSSPDLRPYGLYPTPILGQQPTMCPVFDMMNHIRETNVLVADTLIHSGPSQEEEQEEKNEIKNDDNSTTLTTFQQDHYTPSIVLGALRPIKKGEEIGYSYHATPDVAMSLTRWGFSPNSVGF